MYLTLFIYDEQPNGWTKSFWLENGLDAQYVDSFCVKENQYYFIQEFNIIPTCVRSGHALWNSDCDAQSLVCTG